MPHGTMCYVPAALQLTGIFQLVKGECTKTAQVLRMGEITPGKPQKAGLISSLL